MWRFAKWESIRSWESGRVGRTLSTTNDRARCLVDLAQAIARWNSENRVCELKLVPEAFMRAVAPRLADANFALHLPDHESLHGQGKC